MAAHNFGLSEIFSKLGLPVGSRVAGLVLVVTFCDVQKHSLCLKHPCAIFSNILNIAPLLLLQVDTKRSLFLYTTYLESKANIQSWESLVQRCLRVRLADTDNYCHGFPEEQLVFFSITSHILEEIGAKQRGIKLTCIISADRG